MATVEIFDPAMCCSTGVCGTDVDPTLARFAADLEWLSERRVDMPIKCFEMPLKLQHGELTLPRSYIYATRITPADTFGRFANRAKTEPGWNYHEIEASHSPHVTAPETLMNGMSRPLWRQIATASKPANRGIEQSQMMRSHSCTSRAACMEAAVSTRSHTGSSPPRWSSAAMSSVSSTESSTIKIRSGPVITSLLATGSFQTV